MLSARDKIVSNAKDKIIDWSKDKSSIYRVEWIPPVHGLLQVLIVYKKDKDLQANIASGLVEQTKAEFLRILEEVGYFKENPRDVYFEFDSHENIKKNYEGSYFLRLR